jgi:putative membrane protein
VTPGFRSPSGLSIEQSIESRPWRRLHWATLPISALGLLRAAIIPLAVVIFSRRNSESMGSAAAAGIATAIGLLVALWRYYGLRFFVNGIELVVERGLIGREVRTIRLEQIQDLRVKQGVMHRLLGVADVEIETAGGKGAEQKLSALSLKDIEELRGQIESARSRQTVGQVATSTAPEMSAPVQVLHQVSLRELVVAGLTSNSILSGLAVLGMAWGLLNDFIPERQIFNAIRDGIISAKTQLGAVSEASWITTAVLVVIVATGLLLIALTFSVAGTISRYFNYRITHSPRGLVREGGLLTRHSSTLAVDRVQTMSFSVGILRRPLGRMAVYVTTAASKADEDQNKQDMLLPIARCEQAPAIAGLILPSIARATVDSLRRVARVQVSRGTKKSIIFFVIVSTALVVFYQSAWPLLLLTMLPLSYAMHLRSWKVSGFKLVDGIWHMRQGLIGWTYRLIPASNTQVVVLRQSPFDRRYGVASIYIDCAGEQTSPLGNIPLQSAIAIAASMLNDACATPWPPVKEETAIEAPPPQPQVFSESPPPEPGLPPQHAPSDSAWPSTPR